MSASATIEARHTASDIGAAQLDHDAWKQASAICINRYWSGIEAPASRQAEARIIWTESALCVRFVCQQHEPLVVSSAPQVHEKSVGLWDRDVCEVFVAPEPAEPSRYFEFEAAPTGEWIDLAIQKKADGRETDWEFHSGMTAAGRIAKGQTIIVIRIPWNVQIHKPLNSEKWRVNLFRCIGSGPDRGYLTWQPTRTEQPDFHVPEVFGWLVFK